MRNLDHMNLNPMKIYYTVSKKHLKTIRLYIHLIKEVNLLMLIIY